MAHTADSFAQAHGQTHDGAETLYIRYGHAIFVSQNELSVAKNTGEGIIDLVPKDFGDIRRYFSRLESYGRFQSFGQAPSSFDEAGSQGQEVADLSYEIDIACGNQRSNFRLPLLRRQHNYWNNIQYLLQNFGEWQTFREVVSKYNYARRAGF
jgi:hypothetical protein